MKQLGCNHLTEERLLNLSEHIYVGSGPHHLSVLSVTYYFRDGDQCGRSGQESYPNCLLLVFSFAIFNFALAYLVYEFGIP